MKIYIESYMTRDGQIFMVSWILREAHLKEMETTQIQEAIALRKLTTLVYNNLCERTHMNFKIVLQ
jgi:hypothetical protein